MNLLSARQAPRALAGLAVALIVVILGPAVALAHASLVTSDPADGATLASSPAAITAAYAKAFDPGRSSMVLVGPDGATLAKSVAATAATAESMTIAGFGTLAAGTYRVLWTTITPEDNGIERGTFTFTVAAAPPSGSSPSAAGAGASASPGQGSGAASGGVGDVTLPLVALVVFVVAGLAWFLRRSR